MKVQQEEWTQVTQVLATYTDPFHEDVLTAPRESDNAHYTELVSVQEPEVRKRSRWLWSTNSVGKMRWDLAIIFLSVYSALVAPLELAFSVVSPTQDHYAAVKTLDYTTNVLFAADILVNFRCTFLNDLNDEVWDAAAIAGRYLKGAFALDIVACVPYEVLIVLAGVKASARTLRIISLVKLIRLVRLRRIFYFLRANKDFKLSLQLFLIISSVLLYTHVVACVWFAIVSVEGEWLPPNFLNKHEEFFSEMNELDQYLTSFYFTLLLSGGYDAIPSNALECAFAAAVATFGSIVTAIVLSYITVTLDSFSKQSANYIDTLESAQQVMLAMRLPTDVQSHVTAYFEYTHRMKSQQQNLQTFLSSLSSPLRLQVVRSLISSTLRKHPVFIGKERAILSLEARVTLRNCNPEEKLFTLGSEAEDLYVICSGEVMVTTREVAGIPSSSRLLRRGTLFGEIGLVMSCRRTATASTKNFSTLGSISRGQLQELLAGEGALKEELAVMALSYKDGWRNFVVKALSRVSYLRKCAFDELQMLSFRASEVKYAKGETLMQRGEKTRALLVIAAGTVSGLLKTKQGTDVCVLKLAQGDLAGVYSVLDRSPLALTLSASTDCIVVQFSTEVLTCISHTAFAKRTRSAAQAVADISEHFNEMYEKTGDFQVRALANM